MNAQQETGLGFGHRVPFPCTEWDFNSNLKINQNKHLNFHTGKKPYNAESGMKPNMKTSSFGSLYTCEKCDETFLNKPTLAMHMSCCIGKDQSFKSHLDRLINPPNNQYKVQDNEKPYTCSSCDYKNPNREAMKSHMNSHKVKTSIFAKVLTVIINVDQLTN